jgi:hypothetical protein
VRKPRYEGHRQPRVPVWGPEDEADPIAMAKRIDAAADHGVDVFLIDWYWYGGRPFLERALNDGYLTAANRGRLKFALMWANHDWRAIFPAEIGKESRVMFPGVVSPGEWDSLCDHIVGDYFARPEYYRVDGALPPRSRHNQGAGGRRGNPFGDDQRVERVDRRQLPRTRHRTRDGVSGGDPRRVRATTIITGATR